MRERKSDFFEVLFSGLIIFVLVMCAVGIFVALELHKNLPENVQTLLQLLGIILSVAASYMAGSHIQENRIRKQEKEKIAQVVAISGVALNNTFKSLWSLTRTWQTIAAERDYRIPASTDQSMKDTLFDLRNSIHSSMISIIALNDDVENPLNLPRLSSDWRCPDTACQLNRGGGGDVQHLSPIPSRTTEAHCKGCERSVLLTRLEDGTIGSRFIGEGGSSPHRREEARRTYRPPQETQQNYKQELVNCPNASCGMPIAIGVSLRHPVNLRGCPECLVSFSYVVSDGSISLSESSNSRDFHDSELEERRGQSWIRCNCGTEINFDQHKRRNSTGVEYVGCVKCGAILRAAADEALSEIADEHRE